MIKRLECAFAEVYFIYGVGHDNISKELNKVFTKGHNFEDNKEAAGKAFSMDGSSGGRVFFLWIDSKYNKINQLLFLVHELMHIVVYISQYIGTEIDDSSGEWSAYLQEDLLRQALLIINKKNHVKSKKIKHPRK